MNVEQSSTHISTGVAGLDMVLGGGVPRGSTCLVQGGTGTGKTTLGLQFLLAGIAAGEPGLFVTLSQTEAWLHRIARGYGWSLDGIDLLNATAIQLSDPAQEQLILHSADLELSELTRIILDAFERQQPQRLVLDALSYLRLLAGSPLRYRQAVLALQQHFAASETTVLILDDMNAGLDHAGIHNLVDCILQFDQVVTEHGSLRRYVRILKLRAHSFAQGLHDLRIHDGGLAVFPKIQVLQESMPDVPDSQTRPQLSTGVDTLDELLGGGVAMGSSTMLIGAAGTGKTSLVTLFAHAMVRQERCAALFLFDESIPTFLARSENLGLNLRPYLSDGRLLIFHIDAGEMSPVEFAHRIHTTVEEHNAELVAIDSLTGYVNAIAQERRLLIQMHELITYLSRLNVLSIFTVAQHGLLGMEVDSELDISYLADVIILLRHFEDAGRVRKALSIIKKRCSTHEHSIRELVIGADGVRVGETLHRFQHILSGRPFIQYLWQDRTADDHA